VTEQNGQVIFYVDRPVTGKCRALVPCGSVDLAEVRQVCGANTRPEIRPYLGETDEDRDAALEAGTAAGLDEIFFSRAYTQAVATWLRQRGTVKLRAFHAADAHCSPQCEGAWKHQEDGREHSETCTCRCGGYRHDTARPWFARHEMLSENIGDGGLVTRVWKLGPLTEDE
jgi:hypothetical protein